MDRTNQKASTGKFRKVLLGLGVIAVAGVAMSAAPAMARDRYEDRDRGERHEAVERHEGFERRERVEEFRRERRFEDRIWVPARYELRTYVDDCGRTVSERVCVEPGHYVIR